MTAANLPSNIPNPDPSVVANERLQEAKLELRREMLAKHEEAKGWVDSLQLLHEEKIKRSEDATSSLDRVVQTRLAGSETALNAAMAASDKVTQKIELNISSVLMELKSGFAKQIDSINEKIEDLKKRSFESGGRTSGVTSTISLIISGLSAVAAIVSVVVVLSRPMAVDIHGTAPSHSGVNYR